MWLALVVNLLVVTLYPSLSLRKNVLTRTILITKQLSALNEPSVDTDLQPRSAQSVFSNRLRVLSLVSYMSLLATTSQIVYASTSTTKPMSLEAIESLDKEDVVFPLEMLDGVLCMNYTISRDSQHPLRAIVDTASPFIIIPTICTQTWGCLSQPELSTLQVTSNFTDTVEIYGGQEYDTEWRNVPLSLGSYTKDVLVATVGKDILLPPGGVFFGLIKYNTEYIRPTFLGQTSVQSIKVDTKQNQLTLSSKPQIKKGSSLSFSMFDMRPLGDSVYHYAARVKDLLINGRSVTENWPLAQPLYCVFDTGTSGCLLQEEIYFSEDMPLPARSVTVLLDNTQGEEVAISAKATRDEIFVVSPNKIPWFNPRLNKHPESLPPYDDNGKFEPRIIVLGMCFMKNKVLTIDIEEKKIELA